jgi:hypothetical protein
VYGERISRTRVSQLQEEKKEGSPKKKETYENYVFVCFQLVYGVLSTKSIVWSSMTAAAAADLVWVM